MRDKWAIYVYHDSAGFTINAWLKSFDPEPRAASGYPSGLADFGSRDEALEFDSVFGATMFWRQQDEHYPIRPDGKPNRPLTALTVSITREENPPLP